MNKENAQKFLTVAEFAKLSGDCESTVRRAIKAGELPYQQRGPRKKIKIPAEALALLAEQSSAESTLADQSPQSKPIPGPRPKWMD